MRLVCECVSVSLDKSERGFARREAPHKAQERLVVIFYFSGTGNSLWVARTLARKLNQPLSNLVDHWEDDFWRCDDSFVGFVLPTYMNDVPWLVKRVLETLELTNARYCFVLMTSSSGKSGKAFNSIDAVLQAAGSQLHAAFDLQMPGNCLVSSEEENKKRLAAAPLKVANIADVVERETHTYRSRAQLLPDDFVESTPLYGISSRKHRIKLKHFEVTKDCNMCGVCVRVCPTCNIEIVDGQVVIHGEACAACYACLHWCPQAAVKLDFIPLKKKRFQYHHPDVTLEDMLYE